MDNITEHVLKYYILSKLARSPSLMTFKQLLRGDAEEAKKIFKRMMSWKRSGPLMVKEVNGKTRFPKLINLQAHVTKKQAVLDTGAIPNLISDALAKKLSITPEDTTRRITMADVKTAVVLLITSKFPDVFEYQNTNLYFLVVEGVPVYLIILYPTVKRLNSR